MKKFLLINLIFLPLLTFAQETFVVDDAIVKVMPKTLFFHGSGLQVAATATFTNNGNLKVDAGEMLVTPNTTNDNFKIVYTDDGGTSTNGVPATDGYGQLIINEVVPEGSVTGNISVDRGIGLNSKFENYVQSAFPFKGLTGATLASGAGLTLSDKGRGSHALFSYNNTTISYDQVAVTTPIDPFAYYVVADGTDFAGYRTATKISHKGAPKHISSSIPINTTVNGQPTGDISTLRNSYNEKYITYLDDPFQSTNTAADWGRNMSQFGNPYTSNLDLSYIGFAETATLNGTALNDENAIGNLFGIYKYSTVVNNNGSITGYNYDVANIAVATATAGKFVAGDVGVLIIKPFEAFIIKLRDNVATNFNFNDGLKTFNYNARVVNNPTGTGTVAYRIAGKPTTKEEFYQVEVNLIKNNSTLLNKTYVVANSTLSNGKSNGKSNGLEALATVDGTGVFTNQELVKGEGEDPALASEKYLINQINTSYLGTAIPLHLNVISSDAGSTFTFNFGLDLNLNRLDPTTNFDNPDVRYYFRDNQENVTLLINSGTEYTFTQNTSTANRFQLFYGAAKLGIEDIPVNSLSSTVVYKGNDDNYSIRFDKNWKNANVAVYTAMGQLVFSNKKVDATTDYVLPISNKNTTVYLVQIENIDTGEIVSKKIVK